MNIGSKGIQQHGRESTCRVRRGEGKGEEMKWKIMAQMPYQSHNFYAINNITELQILYL